MSSLCQLYLLRYGNKMEQFWFREVSMLHSKPWIWIHAFRKKGLSWVNYIKYWIFLLCIIPFIISNLQYLILKVLRGSCIHIVGLVVWTIVCTNLLLIIINKSNMSRCICICICISENKFRLPPWSLLIYRKSNLGKLLFR